VLPVFVIAAAVFVGVIGVVIFVGIRNRDRGDIETEDELPPQLHGKTFAEITWTILPALVLLVVGLFTVVVLSDLNAPPTAEALKVRVEGQQWWWRFTYDTDNNGEFGNPGDVITADELVIPTGREIALDETSNDVIHSFWIPALNGKKDAVPGLITNWKLQADHEGVYRGQCTEFCGLSHANMRMVVRAVSAGDFTAWQSNQVKKAADPPAGSQAAAGKDVFTQQLCSSCHLIRGVNDAKVTDPKTGVKQQLVSGVAPDLTHFATRGTFAGSIFNSRYPNPADQQDKPFGQTCTVLGLPGGASLDGKPSTQVGATTNCPDPNQADSSDIPFATEPGNPSNPADKTALAAWLRNPPGMKPMSPDPAQNPFANPGGGTRGRGMPNLNLSEQQIDQLVAYLSSLT
jgi:cytochrome c oxidase subunit 2